MHSINNSDLKSYFCDKLLHGSEHLPSDSAVLLLATYDTNQEIVCMFIYLYKCLYVLLIQLSTPSFILVKAIICSNSPSKSTHRQMKSNIFKVCKNGSFVELVINTIINKSKCTIKPIVFVSFNINIMLSQ